MSQRRVASHAREILIFALYGRCAPRGIVLQTWEAPSIGAEDGGAAATKNAPAAAEAGAGAGSSAAPLSAAAATERTPLNEDDVLSQPFVNLLAVVRERRPNFLRLKTHWQCLGALFAIHDQYQPRRILLGLALVWASLQKEQRVYRWFEHVRTRRNPAFLHRAGARAPHLRRTSVRCAAPYSALVHFAISYPPATRALSFLPHSNDAFQSPCS